MVKKIMLLFVAIASFITQAVFAQANMDDKESVMRSGNKIYVVLVVCLTILIGLILYVVRVDRKIKKIEDKS